MKKYIITHEALHEVAVILTHYQFFSLLDKINALKPIEPLSLEVIKEFKAKYPSEDLCHWSYNMGAADAERHFIGDAK